MQIQRNYVHRTYGDIGKVDLVAPDGDWTLDGKPLPATSVEHLVFFALQTLQDSYAGAKNSDEATAEFGKKYDKLIAGTLGVRGSGDGASAATTEARSITRTIVKASMGSKSPEWAKFTGLDDKAQIAKLDEWAASIPDLEAKVAERLAAKAKEAAEKAKLAKKVTFKI